MADIIANKIGMRFANGQVAVEDVDFNISSGEFVSFVGPSGCGKSTLLRMIAGLIDPTSGTMTVGGQAPNDARRNRHRLGFVFQEANLLPWRTVTENIQLPLELDGIAPQERAQLATRSLALIGLTEADAGKRPHMLSGGMKMRVSLARALVTAPDVLLLDEPFAALDDLMRQQLNEELRRIWAQQQWTAAFVTHNVAEAVFLSQRIFVLGRSPGRIVADVPVPLGEVRSAELRSQADFAQLCGRISRLLRETQP